MRFEYWWEDPDLDGRCNKALAELAAVGIKGGQVPPIFGYAFQNRVPVIAHMYFESTRNIVLFIRAPREWVALCAPALPETVQQQLLAAHEDEVEFHIGRDGNVYPHVFGPEAFQALVSAMQNAWGARVAV